MCVVETQVHRDESGILAGDDTRRAQHLCGAEWCPSRCGKLTTVDNGWFEYLVGEVLVVISVQHGTQTRCPVAVSECVPLSPVPLGLSGCPTAVLRRDRAVLNS